jgi:hypothetical protein
MKINRKDVVIIILLVTTGAVFLVFGGRWFQWSDLIRGNLSVFIFSLTILYFSFSYDKWKQDKEKEDKRLGILKGIYKEIIERARYLEYYQNECEKRDSPYFVNVASFPNSAWESAISNGYYNPQDQSWADYAYIYSATDNINLNLNLANDIFFKSTAQPELLTKHLTSIYALLRRQVREVMVIISESTKSLENELSISRDDIIRINDEIRKRVNITLGNHKESGVSESTGEDSAEKP